MRTSNGGQREASINIDNEEKEVIQIEQNLNENIIKQKINIDNLDINKYLINLNIDNIKAKLNNPENNYLSNLSLNESLYKYVSLIDEVLSNIEYTDYKSIVNK